MYSILGYGSMIADSERTNAYVKALQRTITPDSVVLDIGTGTGIFALLACQLGARRVYAIEPSDVIQIAREIAAANGYAARIEFIQDLSTQVVLPEAADIFVSDLYGIMPLFGQRLLTIMDAKQRLLAPHGILIPGGDLLWAAVVEGPELYDGFVAPWEQHNYGLDMSAARRAVTNTWSKERIASAQLLVPPQVWAKLDYSLIESTDVRAEVTWTMTRSGIGHGLALWFDSLLLDGIGFSNAPDSPEMIYGQAFFPWSEPVQLAPGNVIQVSLQANLVNDEYVWHWQTRILEQQNSQQLKATFKQSTFFGEPLSPAHLQKSSANYVPCLNLEGQIDQLILSLMNSGTSLGEIAHQVYAQFSSRFTSWQDALNRVSQLSHRYS